MSTKHVPPARMPGAGPVAPSVDVLMLAYNVERYIEQAANGVLAQRFDHPMRLVIAEDRSTDGTASICQRLASAHPDRILYLPGDVNLGIMGRTEAALRSCTAEYVAICDSDDIWTDPDKLAKQVAFLEAHRDHGISYSDVDIISGSGEVLPDEVYAPVRACYAEGDVFMQLLRGNFINNSTSVVRRNLLYLVPSDPSRDHYIGDYLRWLRLSIHTKVHFLPGRTTAYRRGGITTSPDLDEKNHRKMKKHIGEILLEHGRRRDRVAAEDARVLARKIAGVLARNGTAMRVRVGLAFLLFKYLTATLGGTNSVRQPRPADQTHEP